MDPVLGMLIILGGVLVLFAVGAIAYAIIKKKVDTTSSSSIPQGSDYSETGKLLGEKYQAERDSGEFKHKF
jgi:hypothetical protein